MFQKKGKALHRTQASETMALIINKYVLNVNHMLGSPRRRWNVETIVEPFVFLRECLSKDLPQPSGETTDFLHVSTSSVRRVLWFVTQVCAVALAAKDIKVAVLTAKQVLALQV